VTARDAYNVFALLDLHKIACTCIGRHFGKHKAMKAFGLVLRSAQLLPFAMRHLPRVAVSHGSRAQTLAARLLGIPSVVIADYEHVKHLIRPDWIVVPDVIPMEAARRYSNRVLTYPGI
jgi:predicted glycosyltransferase